LSIGPRPGLESLGGGACILRAEARVRPPRPMRATPKGVAELRVANRVPVAICVGSRMHALA
jgi:hypothetical protein